MSPLSEEALKVDSDLAGQKYLQKVSIGISKQAIFLMLPIPQLDSSLPTAGRPPLAADSHPHMRT